MVGSKEALRQGKLREEAMAAGTRAEVPSPPNTALHLTAYSLCFAALRSGFRQQVSFGVVRH
jgi:hypothetical protein